MKLKDYLFSTISGILLMLSFPSMFNRSLNGYSGILAFIALAPLLMVIFNKTKRQAFILGFIAGFVYLGGSVYWLTNMTELGILAYPAWLMLALYLASFVGLFALLANITGPAFTPFVWVGIELLRAQLFTGFPWVLLGYSQFTNLPLIQITEITGIYGISFILASFNTGIALFFTPNKGLKKWLPLLGSTLVLLAFFVYGGLRLGSLKQTASSTYNFKVIQGNISQPDKWEPAFSEDAFSKHETLSKDTTGEPKMSVVVWPETATAMYVGYRPEYLARLFSLTKSTGADFLVGSPDASLDKDYNVKEAFNSVFHISKEGKLAGKYAKIHLVPFGEFMPLEKELKFLEKFTAGFNKWGRGEDFVVFKTSEGLTIGTPVCWEVVFPEECRLFVKGGAKYLITVSNDGWYGISSAPDQHFMVLPFRAVENRVSVARAANTVNSGFIDYTGKIIKVLKQGESASMSTALPVLKETGLTFYTRFGDIFAYLCVLIMMIGIFLGVKYQRQATSNKQQDSH